jgi:hypothetical protein
MAKIRNEELAQLAGEVLPERTVLSAVPMNGGSGVSSCNGGQNASGSQNGNLISVGLINQQCTYNGSNTGENSAHSGLLSILGLGGDSAAK